MQTLIREIDEHTHEQPLAAADVVECARCGSEHLDDDRFCVVCGAVTIEPGRFVAAYGPDQ